MVYQMNRASAGPVLESSGTPGAGTRPTLRSQVKPAPFAYHRAHSVAEAVALLAELGDEAKILAGGLSLVPMMTSRLARPTALVDVSRLEGLSYLRADAADGLRIGPLPTHRTVEITRDPAVLGGFGVLARSARWIGHYPLRGRRPCGGGVGHPPPPPGGGPG